MANTGLRNSVLVVGITSFILFLVVTFVFVCCTPCVAILAGAGAGWLAAHWSRPKTQDAAVRIGALAGVLSGLGALVGQVVGAILSVQLITPEMVSDAYETVTQFYQSVGPETLEGLEIPGTEFVTRAALLTQAGCGVVNVGIMAGLGALAGLLYFRYRNSQRGPLDEEGGFPYGGEDRVR